MKKNLNCSKSSFLCTFSPHFICAVLFTTHSFKAASDLKSDLYSCTDVSCCRILHDWIVLHWHNQYKRMLVKQEQNICLTLHLQKTIAQKRSALTCLSELLRNSSSSSETCALSKTADHYYTMFCTGTCLFLSRWCQVFAYCLKETKY